jgi:hypothetical protein
MTQRKPPKGTVNACQEINVAIPEHYTVSRRSDLIGISVVLLVFCTAYFVSGAETALALSIIIGVFVAIIQTKPERQRDRRFWLLIAIIALVHVAALCLIRIPKLRFGLISLPVALADGFLIWGVISWIERRFPSQS